MTPHHVRCVVAVKDLRRKRLRAGELGYVGSVGPSPVASKPGRAPPRGRSAGSASTVVFNQNLTLAPIKSKNATLVIDVTDTKHKVKLCSAAFALANLDHQRTESITLACVRGPDPRLAAAPDETKPVLYVKAKFQFSRVLPLKHQIYGLLDVNRKLERDITNLKNGKPLDHDWDWPEDSHQRADRADAHAAINPLHREESGA